MPKESDPADVCRNSAASRLPFYLGTVQYLRCFAERLLQVAEPTNRYEASQQILDQYVSDIHAHHSMMGYRSIRDALALKFGWLVSDPCVWKSMRRLHICGYTRRRKILSVGGGIEHARYPNLLARNFSATEPMEKIVTDVTYLKFQGKWYYLAAYLDYTTMKS